MTAQALAQDGSDRLSKRNFDRLARYIYSYSGIKMPPTKLTMVEGRLRRRLRSTGIATLDAYCDFLFQENGIEQEGVYLIDAVTTNKTDFFREPGHYDFMRDEALPALVERGVRRVRAWSAACSTGAEPYTMAMVLEEFASNETRIDYRILATDLSTDVLARAHRGIFDEELVNPVAEPLRRKYVMQARDPGRRKVRIHPGLRSKVAFGRMNLMDTRYPIGDPVHIIFCRNVLIYFDRAAQAAVLQRLCDRLDVGGYLFIGHAESAAGVPLPIKQVGNTVFQRV
jgi:chemotaxis protein methyltransferase CheR